MNTENNSTDTKTDSRSPRRGGKGRHRADRSASEGRGSRGAGRRGGPTGRGRGPKTAARRGGRKRPLAHGDLRLLILNIIKTTPSHGYGLITEIKTLTSGIYEPSPGVIYPALEALQDLGWVDIQPEKGKRILHITDEGRAELKAQTEALANIEARLKTLASNDTELEADDIRGALRQLKHTTTTTFRNKDIDIETRKTAVTILEDARKKIAALV